MSNFTLKDFGLISSSSTDVSKVVMVQIEKLRDYANHKYKLHTGERFQEMVESVKNHGIIMPLIVRPTKDVGIYEILAGHNRCSSAKEAGLQEVPCIIMKDLTDIEAKLIVHITNVNQRSIDNYSHSERAAVIADYHEAVKQQGKRTDLLQVIDELLSNESESAENTMQQSTSEKFCMSKDSIARYVRINKLILAFKIALDENEIKIRTGVELSYLDTDSQLFLFTYLKKNSLKIDYEKAKQVRYVYDGKKLKISDIQMLFQGEQEPKLPKKISVNRKKVEQYFTGNESSEDIEEIIIEALKLWKNR